MTSIADGSVIIQTSATSVPAPPSWFGEVVLMADVEEFSYREIADALKIPLGTVMSRLSRGRNLVRHELAEVARGYGIGSGSEGKRKGDSA